MTIKKNPLRGEERRIVSTRIYTSEFLRFRQVCEMEGKTVNSMLREMIREKVGMEVGE